MRILCLHDINSSAPLLLNQLYSFAKKLYDSHGIELAFVDSPLIIISTSNNNEGSNDNENDIRRTWYYANNNNANNNNANNNNANNNKINGLDASILNLHQIWKQSYYTNNPFCGLLGIGQGASLAALLPLLQTVNTFDCNEDGDESGDENEDGDNNMIMMFEGIQVCIFYNGYDLLNQNYNTNCDNNNVDHFYEQVQNISS